MADAILITNAWFDENRNLVEGGAQIHLREIAKVLLSQNLSVKVVQKWNKDEIIQQEENFTVEGCREFFPRLNLFWRKKIDKQAKIIHLNFMSFSFPFASNRFTITCHGVGWDIPIRDLPSEWLHMNKSTFRFKTWLMRKWQTMNFRYAVRRCNKVLSVDSSLLRIVQHEMTDYRHKIEVIPNFVDTTSFYPCQSKLRGKIGLDNNETIILYPRNVNLSRGYHILYEIVSNLARQNLRFKFMIAGTSLSIYKQSHYERGLTEKLCQQDLLEYVSFLGSITHEEMNEVYNASDIVIIPSYFSEGTSLSALEAMACGKPVIASNIGGLNDIIIDGYNGFLVRPIAEEFIDKIIYLSQHEEQARKIGSTALQLVGEVYNKERWEKQVVKFFEF